MALRLYDFYPKKCHPFQPQVTPKDQSLPGFPGSTGLLPQLAASAAASVASVASAAGGASCSGPGSTTSMGAGPDI